MKMVLENYMSEKIHSPGFDALVYMSFCKSIIDVARKMGDSGGSKQIERVRRAVKDYVHYRDVAIRFGENVSKFPKTLKRGKLLE